MNKEFVKYEQALALKELGFDEPCLAGYQLQTATLFSDIPHTLNGNIHRNSEGSFTCAPLFQQAIRFFEEKFGLYCEIQIDKTTEPKWCFTISKFIGNPKDLTEKEWGWENVPVDNWYLYRTRKEAELACLSKLIETSK
jgi:hypothetical protein